MNHIDALAVFVGMWVLLLVFAYRIDRARRERERLIALLRETYRAALCGECNGRLQQYVTLVDATAVPCERLCRGCLGDLHARVAKVLEAHHGQ